MGEPTLIERYLEEVVGLSLTPEQREVAQRVVEAGAQPAVLRRIVAWHSLEETIQQRLKPRDPAEKVPVGLRNCSEPS